MKPLVAALLAKALMIGTLALPASAAEIWVSNEKDDTISVIDVESLEVVRTIPTGERPRGITFSKDFSRLYVCASDSDAVQVMDPETGKILHELPSGEDPEQFVLHPDDRRLYIANEDDAVTTVVDTETRKVVAQINVGIEPEGEGFFYHVYQRVTGDARAAERIDSFRNMYGFTRNLSAAAAISLLALVIAWLRDKAVNPWLVAGAAAFFVVFLFRFLKFYRDFAVELLRIYSELDLETEG